MRNETVTITNERKGASAYDVSQNGIPQTRTSNSPTGSILTRNDYKLLNLKGLSQEMNVSYDFVKDMRSAGFEAPIGGLTTLTHAIDWLNSNPNFRENARLLKQSERRVKTSRRQQTIVDIGG